MKYAKIILLALVLCQLGACKEQAQDDNKKIARVDETLRYANWTAGDSMQFEQIMKYARESKLDSKEISEIEIAIAKLFLGTPYVGKTLEMEGDEALVINLHELDCTTFLENVVSLSLCVKEQKMTFSDYASMLTSIRYRDGFIRNYPSRLHYFTDWLIHNQKRGLLTIISNEFSQDSFDTKVDWMSTHPEFYTQLGNVQFLIEIAGQEEEISQQNLNFVPKNKIDEIVHLTRNGDLIAITTDIDGLDIAHVGLAYFIEGKLHLIHASSAEKKVVISKNTLQSYLEPQEKRTGIIVARLK